MISAKRPTMPPLRGAKTQKPEPHTEPFDSIPDAGEPSPSPAASGPFHPKPLQTIADSHLPDSLIESILFKHLLAVGHATGRNIATAIAMPAKPIIEMLAAFKARQFVYYKDSTAMGDFEYTLTDAGRERARVFVAECSYVGPAPVTLEDYITSVAAQSITRERARKEDLQRAFDGLLINEHMFERLGPAINSGRGLFLYGFPGNGKTSIAERITSCFGGAIWVPYAIYTSGEMITFFDPECHEPVENDAPSILNAPTYDNRWIRIKRPTLVVGGELMMDSLELQPNHVTKITEPSLQLKSNTGTLVIDDFGRQRVSPIELLNRWIIPLEKRYDFLTLANGKKIKVPFDQLIIFSTNLEPKDLVDDAFLRRIPYKINVMNPSEEEFRKLFDIMAPIVGVDVKPGAVDALVERHYKAVNRPFRCCQPRDLLLQVKNFSAYKGATPIGNTEALDAAVENYFAIM
ncbi:MAG: AAA family ATPase [Phycisphaerales bacterium]|nr:AAA family ATPase [Phycisphaerales bacterium]